MKLRDILLWLHQEHTKARVVGREGYDKAMKTQWGVPVIDAVNGREALVYTARS